MICFIWDSEKSSKLKNSARYKIMPLSKKKLDQNFGRKKITSNISQIYWMLCFFFFKNLIFEGVFGYLTK